MMRCCKAVERTHTARQAAGDWPGPRALSRFRRASWGRPMSTPHASSCSTDTSSPSPACLGSMSCRCLGPMRCTLLWRPTSPCAAPTSLRTQLGHRARDATQLQTLESQYEARLRNTRGRTARRVPSRQPVHLTASGCSSNFRARVCPCSPSTRGRVTHMSTWSHVDRSVGGSSLWSYQ